MKAMPSAKDWPHLRASSISVIALLHHVQEIGLAALGFIVRGGLAAHAGLAALEGLRGLLLQVPGHLLRKDGLGLGNHERIPVILNTGLPGNALQGCLPFPASCSLFARAAEAAQDSALRSKKGGALRPRPSFKRQS